MSEWMNELMNGKNQPNFGNDLKLYILWLFRILISPIHVKLINMIKWMNGWMNERMGKRVLNFFDIWEILNFFDIWTDQIIYTNKEKISQKANLLFIIDLIFCSKIPTDRNHTIVRVFSGPWCYYGNVILT